MKKFYLFLELLLIVANPCYSQYDNASFKLMAEDLQELSFISGTIYKDTVLAIGIDNPVYGFSISGTSTVPNKNSFVRVVMKSSEGREFLVYETNNLLSASSAESFYNISFETSMLDGVIPDSLILQVTEGSIALNKLCYSITSSPKEMRSLASGRDTNIRVLQAEVIAEQLNENLRNQNKLWRAGITDIALMSYEEKKALFGGKVPNLQGLEYYKGGIIDLSSNSSVNQRMLTALDEESNDSTLYYPLNKFDWRDRDGINWMTPVKNQFAGTCWLFSSIGMVEAAVNIYFNQKIDYNLSEQDVVSCGNFYYEVFNGGSPFQALNYIRYYGVVDEACFPWQQNYYPISCDEKGTTPEDVIHIDYRYDSIPPSLWKEKIHKSPCLLGFKNEDISHAVILTGYKQIAIGDTIFNDQLDDDLILDANNIPYNKTAWIFKNSWGSSWGDGGYGYFIVDEYSSLELWQVTHVSSQVYTSGDNVAVDNDGDGYYHWGMGNIPDDLPEWAPRVQDGDDTNADYGPVYDLGLLRLSPDLYDTIVYDETTLWHNEDYVWQHVKIVDGGELEIIHDVTMYKDATITVESGGLLLISGGYLYQANIIVQEGGTLRINDGGMLKIKDNDALIVETGGVLDIQHGSIKLMH